MREEVIELMGPDLLARALSQLDPDDAVGVFADLDEEAQSRILARLPQGLPAPPGRGRRSSRRTPPDA